MPPEAATGDQHAAVHPVRQPADRVLQTIAPMKKDDTNIEICPRLSPISVA
jgi:hypothetical protein